MKHNCSENREIFNVRKKFLLNVDEVHIHKHVSVDCVPTVQRSMYKEEKGMKKKKLCEICLD
jgi:hypothetical protein